MAFADCIDPCAVQHQELGFSFWWTRGCQSLCSCACRHCCQLINVHCHGHAAFVGKLELCNLGKLELCDSSIQMQVALTLGADPPSAYTVPHMYHSYRHTKLSSDMESVIIWTWFKLASCVQFRQSQSPTALLLLGSAIASHYTYRYVQRLLSRFVLLNLHMTSLGNKP